MGDIQIIYSSHPFGFDETILSSILSDARRLNSRDGITGALVCRRDLYLQLLEGPEQAVRDTYERIRRDDRHVNIKQLVSEPITTRLFGNWDMLHDPAHSWHWTAREIDDGTMDRAATEDVCKVFKRLAAEMQGEQAG